MYPSTSPVRASLLPASPSSRLQPQLSAKPGNETNKASAVEGCLKLQVFQGPDGFPGLPCTPAKTRSSAAMAFPRETLNWCHFYEG